MLAYGMTQAQAEALVAASEKVDGILELLVPQGGTVVRDDFVLGELVEPGRVLLEITDESVRWVDALEEWRSRGVGVRSSLFPYPG